MQQSTIARSGWHRGQTAAASAWLGPRKQEACCKLHLAPGSNTKAALAHKYSHSGQQAWFCRPVIQPESAHRGVGPQRCVVLGVQVLEHAQKGQGTQGALQALAVRVTCHAAAAHRCRAQSCVRKEVARLSSNHAVQGTVRHSSAKPLACCYWPCCGCASLQGTVEAPGHMVQSQLLWGSTRHTAA